MSLNPMLYEAPKPIGPLVGVPHTRQRCPSHSMSWPANYGATLILVAPPQTAILIFSRPKWQPHLFTAFTPL